MAFSDKNIVIIPSIGASTGTNPRIEFTSGDVSSSATITLSVTNSGNQGTLSFSGNSGQLFSITDSMAGTIFSVNDISGIPSIEVLDTGLIKLAEYNGVVTVGTSTAVSGYELSVFGGSSLNGNNQITGVTTVTNSTQATSTATGALQVAGGVGIAGNLWVGGTINANIQGIISTATNIAGGAAGQIVYQSGPNTTAFAGPGTAGQLLQSNGTSAPSYVNTSSLLVGYAVTSTVANTVLAGQRTTNAAHYLTFVDSNDATPTADAVYTTSSFVINPSTGFVGIGTTAPSTLLDTSATNANNTLRIATSGGNTRIPRVSLARVADTSWNLSILSGFSDFAIDQDSTNRLVIKGGTGNVGIGTASPASTLHVSGDARITGITTVTNTTQSTSTTTGALQVLGGVGIGGNLYVGGEIVAQKLTIQLTTVTTTLIETDDIIRTVNTTQSTSTTTGALQVSGGAGIGGNLYVGGTIFGTINATVNTATNANNVATVARTNNANHSLVFVDSNNASAAYEALYTTSTVFVNPSNGVLYASSIISSAITSGLGYTPSRAASTYTNSVISADTRNVNDLPADRPAGLYVDFKANATTGLSDGGTYHGILNFRAYGSGNDLSGGNVQQLAYTENNNLWHRISTSTSTWGTWVKIIDTGNTSTTLVATSVNLAGGATGSIPYQNAAGTTLFIPIGGNGTLLQSNGTTATWVSTGSLTAGIASSASTVATAARTTNAAHYLTFVDSNNASAAYEPVYTTSSFVVNPSTGNVGIGTTSPDSNLGAYKGLSIDGGTNGAVQIAGTSFSSVLFGDAGDSDVGTIAYGHSSNYMAFYTNAFEQLRITNVGDVGIGITSPAAQLHVATTSTSPARGLTVSQHTTGAPAALINFRKSRGTITAPTIVANNDYTGAFTFLNYDGAAYRSNAGFGARVNGTVTAGSVPTDLYFYTSATDEVDPYVNGKVRMVINSAGNVGIGTTGPTSKLHVDGDARITGITTVTNATSATSTTTGALQVAGGVGIQGDLYARNIVSNGSEVLTTASVITVTPFQSIMVDSVSQQFDGIRSVFDLRVDQQYINSIVDSKDAEVVLNGEYLTPYVDELRWPWFTPYDSHRGFRIVNGITTSSSVQLIIYNAPYIGDSASVIIRTQSTARKKRKYPFSAATIALGD